ncbi:asparagine synthetase domain-containing protein CG17486 [Drosophila innubila]|uniref:asparagine synthetase domain-containing protein CG17486 n=1 Tax=Drosophila innubila TaxID=198719 RepID=UPI00148DBC04|nr:asparagine synthetase domain-containing protein CG17486 [Drosophila innubila]
MCGIFCAISENNEVACELHSALEQLLHNRGPDVNDKYLIDNVLLAGNVLWQQGAAPQKQPITKGELSLLFNGDLYNLETDKPATQSDSAWLMEKLTKCNSDNELLLLLQQLQGPYCLILYNRHENTLYFCRDALGRNSLIIERDAQCIRLLSTSCHLRQTSSLELPPLGLYKLKLAAFNKCELYPWQCLNEGTMQQLQILNATMRWETHVACPIAPQWLSSGVQTTDIYDLYDLVDKTEPKLEQLYERLLDNRQLKKTLQTFDKLLQHSVAQRVLNTAPVCRNCVACGKCGHAKICVLFSGGIDCTILALLADKFVPQTEPIELINVAFERVASATTESSWNVPDRQTSQQSYEELQRLCPQRMWQLHEVNVTRDQLKQQLSSHIHQLIYPLQTVLDESLGCAFWFAASAAKSTARVALLGSGADELFGGYTRHRNAYRRAGNDLKTLHHELEMDWQRIPARNLARDDRVIADCGKTARAPFIEEHVSQFVRSLMPQQRCCYSLPEGVGDKLLLRLYGYSLGLRDAVLLKKRAIQFGSRIADKKQQANQISEYLRFESLQLN